MTPPRQPTEDYPNFATWAGQLARLAKVSTYPVTWVDDPDRVYLTPLTAAQAEGFACVLCAHSTADMLTAGVIQDTPGCGPIYRHRDCHA